MIRIVAGSLAGWAVAVALYPTLGLWAVLVGFVLAGAGGFAVAAVGR